MPDSIAADDNSNRNDDALARSIVLMSALSTAADVVWGMTERRSGRDPADQESAEIVLPELRGAADELEEHIAALYAGRALDAGHADRTMRLARGANEVLLLSRLIRLTHVVHQRLLSLYPQVSEDLIEEARLIERQFTRARDRVPGRVSLALIQRAWSFSRRLAELTGSI